jgi:signal transduction histidine kinase/ActR/RegA family two-component response regulator
MRPADYRLLFEAAPGLYLALAPDLTIIAVSDAYLRATMTARRDIVGRHLFDAFPDNPNDPGATGVANLRASLQRVLARREYDAMAVQKYDIRRPESEGGGFDERFWSPANYPVIDAKSELAFIIHRVEDVTEFVRLKEHERAQERLAEELKTRAGMMEAEVYRRAQEIQEANRSLRVLQAELEMRVQDRTAELQHANEFLQQEITEHRRTSEALRESEAQLRQAQRLEAIGRLAGGIAHDFNNLLTVILSYSEMMLKTPDLQTAGSDLEEIHQAGLRAAELTKQLLAFSRQQILEPVVLNLNDVLGAMSTILGRVVREDIDLAIVPDPDLGTIKADRGQIEQVIMNLIVNARDAMPQGGKLTIETMNVELDEAYVATHLEVEPGSYIMLAVSDTGIGMDRETQEHIFDPFFTTKKLGNGTGLGLATVFGIVKQSGGNIWLYSEPDAGTTLKIYLPRVHAAADVALPALRGPIRGGSETILLAEDEDQVRRIVANVLRHAGYRVFPASSPQAALRVVEEGSEVDLLLTDVVMPGMNGRELAEQIRRLRPGVKVLFMSGYTDDVILRHGVLEAGVAFLEKPITPEALALKVRQALDATSAVRESNRGV